MSVNVVLRDSPEYSPDYNLVDQYLSTGTDEERNQVLVQLVPFKSEKCCENSVEFLYRYAGGIYFEALAIYEKDPHASTAMSRERLLDTLEAINKPYDVMSKANQSAVVLKWKAVIKGFLGTLIKDQRERASIAREVKTLSTQSIELDPTDPVPYYVRGKLARKVASLSPVEKFGVNLLGRLPDVTAQDCIADLKIAAPLFITVRKGARKGAYVVLAACYKMTGQIQEAKKACTQAREAPTITASDRLDNIDMKDVCDGI